jgi:ferredoxin
MGYEVVVDGNECISAGKCVAAAPAFFAFDADEIAIVRADAQPLDDAVLLRIARACPSGAVRLSLDGDVVEV